MKKEPTLREILGIDTITTFEKRIQRKKFVIGIRINRYVDNQYELTVWFVIMKRWHMRLSFDWGGY